jgi:hypothetical protein
MAYTPPDIDVELLVKDYPADLVRVREIGAARLAMFYTDDNSYEEDESIKLYQEYRRLLNKYRHHRSDLMKALTKAYYDEWYG